MTHRLQVDLNNWMVLYTRRDASKAQDFIQTMSQVCPAMGIQVRAPRVFELPSDRTETYIAAVRDNINAEVSGTLFCFRLVSVHCGFANVLNTPVMCVVKCVCKKVKVLSYITWYPGRCELFLINYSN